MEDLYWDTVTWALAAIYFSKSLWMQVSGRVAQYAAGISNSDLEELSEFVLLCHHLYHTRNVICHPLPTQYATSICKERLISNQYLISLGITSSSLSSFSVHGIWVSPVPSSTLLLVSRCHFFLVVCSPMPVSRVVFLFSCHGRYCYNGLSCRRLSV